MLHARAGLVDADTWRVHLQDYPPGRALVGASFCIGTRERFATGERPAPAAGAWPLRQARLLFIGRPGPPASRARQNRTIVRFIPARP
jgi:hypothetical protein